MLTLFTEVADLTDVDRKYWIPESGSAYIQSESLVYQESQPSPSPGPYQIMFASSHSCYRHYLSNQNTCGCFMNRKGPKAMTGILVINE